MSFQSPNAQKWWYIWFEQLSHFIYIYIYISESDIIVECRVRNCKQTQSTQKRSQIWNSFNLFIMTHHFTDNTEVSVRHSLVIIAKHLKLKTLKKTKTKPYAMLSHSSSFFFTTKHKNRVPCSHSSPAFHFTEKHLKCHPHCLPQCMFWPISLQKVRLQIAIAERNLRLKYKKKRVKLWTWLSKIKTKKLNIETEWIIPLEHEFLDFSSNESLIELVKKEESETKVRTNWELESGKIYSSFRNLKSWFIKGIYKNIVYL